MTKLYTNNSRHASQLMRYLGGFFLPKIPVISA